MASSSNSVLTFSVGYMAKPAGMQLYERAPHLRTGMVANAAFAMMPPVLLAALLPSASSSSSSSQQQQPAPSSG